MLFNAPNNQWLYRLLCEYRHRLDVVTSGFTKCRKTWHIIKRIVLGFFYLQLFLLVCQFYSLFPYIGNEHVLFLLTILNSISCSGLLVSYMCLLSAIGEKKYYQSLIQIIKDGINQEQEESSLQNRIKLEKKYTLFSIFKIMIQNCYYTITTFLLIATQVTFLFFLK